MRYTTKSDCGAGIQGFAMGRGGGIGGCTEGSFHTLRGVRSLKLEVSAVFCRDTWA
jgi:hypothetical protein